MPSIPSALNEEDLLRNKVITGYFNHNEIY